MRAFLDTCLLICIIILDIRRRGVDGNIFVIREESGDVVRVIEDRNIRSMSDALEGYVITSNPLNVCELPEPPPDYEPAQNDDFVNTDYVMEVKPKKKFVLLGIIYDCDLTTKAKNAQQSGYAGLIVQNIGTNSSQVVPWHIMRFPLAKINHVVVGEYDGFLLRFNYSYPESGCYIKFEEDHLYQILCYILAGVILLLLTIMFLLFWFQICCTIITLRMPYELGQRIGEWIHPVKRRLTRPMLQLIPIKDWSHNDPFQVCAICQEDFKEQDRVRVLPCVHGYHPVCIDPWLLKRSRKCPNCMRWVKLPNDNEADWQESNSSSSEDSSTEHQPPVNPNTTEASPRTWGRNLFTRSQSQRSQPRVCEEAQELNALPLVELQESPKRNRNMEKESAVKKNVTVTVNIPIPTADQNLSTSDWQLKRFLQAFHFTPTSESTQSYCHSSKISAQKKSLKSLSSSLSVKFLAQSTSVPSSTFPKTEQKLNTFPFTTKSLQKVSRRVETPQEENLLEACLGIPSHCSYHPNHYQKNSSSQIQNDQSSSVEYEVKSACAELVPQPYFPREFSNPGYISLEDDDEEFNNVDERVTEEADITSSFDATTISESLPRDDQSQSQSFSIHNNHTVSAPNSNVNGLTNVERGDSDSGDQDYGPSVGVYSINNDSLLSIENLPNETEPSPKLKPKPHQNTNQTCSKEVETEGQLLKENEN